MKKYTSPRLTALGKLSDLTATIIGYDLSNS